MVLWKNGKVWKLFLRDVVDIVKGLFKEAKVYYTNYGNGYLESVVIHYKDVKITVRSEYKEIPSGYYRIYYYSVIKNNKKIVEERGLRNTRQVLGNVVLYLFFAEQVGI